MSDAVAWSFVALATLALTAAIVALWQSARAAFGLVALDEVEGEGDLEARRALLQEKEAVLRSIRDLAFDHEAGKIADDDFRELDASLRRRAKDVMRRLDQGVAKERAKAEAIIAAHLAKEGLAEGPRTAGKGAKKAAEKGSEKAPTASSQGAAEAAEAPSEDASARPSCASCGTPNDADAAFCKKCGRRLTPTEEVAS